MPLSIPVAEVRDPSIPMAVFNQQGNDLVTFVAQNSRPPPDVSGKVARPPQPAFDPAA